MQRLQLFTTCPDISSQPWEPYLPRVIDVARWAEQHGLDGVLIGSDNRQVDPWLVAQVVVQHTTALCPMVAVQPAYAHPFTVAKAIASLAWLYGRRAYLKLVATGAAQHDLDALGDTLSHEQQYARMTEYARLVNALLREQAVTEEGDFYRVKRLRLVPPISPPLMPGLFVPGASDAGRRAARMLGAVALQCAEPPEADGEMERGIESGVRLGIIARPTSDEAWTLARARFPEHRRGVLLRADVARARDAGPQQSMRPPIGEPRGPYWSAPYERSQTACPYLVGSYDEVADALARYLAAGHTRFILDVPAEAGDLRHARVAFDGATMAAAA